MSGPARTSTLVNRPLHRPVRRHAGSGALSAGKRAALLTVLAALAPGACADPSGPPLPARALELPAEGIFVLAGAPLSVVINETVHAETLFVTSPTTYRLAGGYSGRLYPRTYRERDGLTATFDFTTGIVEEAGKLVVFQGVIRVRDVGLFIYDPVTQTVFFQAGPHDVGFSSLDPFACASLA